MHGAHAIPGTITMQCSARGGRREKKEEKGATDMVAWLGLLYDNTVLEYEVWYGMVWYCTRLYSVGV